MSISVRLNKEAESLLEETTKVLHTTKTGVVRRSLLDYCSRILEEKKSHPYELIKDLLDKVGSGKGDLSIRGEEILRQSFGRGKIDNP